MKKKLLVLLICIPFYPIAMIGEWYKKKTGYGYKFSLSEFNKEYWLEVADYLKE